MRCRIFREVHLSCCYQMFLHLTLEFCIHRCLQCYRRLNLCTNFDAITLTRPDPDLKVNHSGSKKHMHFNSKHVLFLAKEVHIWIRSVLIFGPQYFIYQKRDQKIGQTLGPDEIVSNISQQKRKWKVNKIFLIL